MRKIQYRFRRLLVRLGVRTLQFSGAYKGYWNDWRADDLFAYAESAGLHILPVHYYTPVPTMADFARPRNQNRMTSVDLDVPAGAARANHLIERHRKGIESLLLGRQGYDPANAGFGPMDAAILYAVISEQQPKRMIEIGSGMSTMVTLAAIEDCGCGTMLTCIEPYLPEYLIAARNKIADVIEKPLQEVPLDIFSQLEAGDILFIDSTHVVRYGSDVVYQILEILPALNEGVLVHVHDIFFPNDYPEHWLKKDRFFWNEQYMLQAFLSMNPNFKIEIPLYAVKDLLHLDVPDAEIKASSLWMRRCLSHWQSDVV